MPANYAVIRDGPVTLSSPNGDIDRDFDFGYRPRPVATAFAPGRATGAAPSSRCVHRPAAWATATTRPLTARAK
jgi:hypothetical protein